MVKVQAGMKAKGQGAGRDQKHPEHLEKTLRLCKAATDMLVS